MAVTRASSRSALRRCGLSTMAPSIDSTPASGCRAKASTIWRALLSESRGWLFALPIVLVLALVLMPGSDRLRFALWALLQSVAVWMAVATAMLLAGCASFGDAKTQARALDATTLASSRTLAAVFAELLRALGR